MKTPLFVGLAVVLLALAGVALFLAAEGRRQLRTEEQRTQALEERLRSGESRLTQAEADLGKARGEFAAELGRLRDIQTRQVAALRRLVGEEFMADFSHCFWREGGTPDFDFAPVAVRAGKTTAAVSSNGTHYNVTLSADAATLTLVQDNHGSARASTYTRYARSGDEGDAQFYAGSYRWNGAPPAGAEGHVLLRAVPDGLALPSETPSVRPGRSTPAASEGARPQRTE